MTTDDLSAAVDQLARVAREAGLDEGMARTEARSVAAAVLEGPGPSNAHRLWSDAFEMPASEFFGAVPRGRRYASIPTTLLATLVAESHPRAVGYAQALADVATAAAELPGAGQVALGKALSVQRAQLEATGQLPTHGPGAPTAGLTPPAGSAQEGPASQAGRTPQTGTPSHARGTPSSGFSLPTDRPTLEAFGNDLLRRAQEQSNRVREMLGQIGQHGGVGGLQQPPATPSGGPGQTTPAPGGEQWQPQDGDGGGGSGAAYPDQLATQPPPEDTAAPAEPEPDPEPEKSVEELLAELDELIGLERVKAEIHRQVAVLKMDARRQEAGLRVVTLTRHLVFVGNPGTGKTTVARLVGGIYRALGLLSKGQLVEVDRSELVAGYLGQTAAKTSEVVKSAMGGVLFIDEAYSLSGDQYGKEAVDTLVKEMEDHRDDLVVIVAGYPAPMAEFIALNPGLESRFRTIIEFDDYSDEELVGIQHVLAEKMDYDISPEAEERFRELLAATPRGPSFGNGRFSRNMLEAAIGRHAWRLREEPDVTMEQLRTLERQDFEDRDGVDLYADPVAPGSGDLEQEPGLQPPDVREPGTESPDAEMGPRPDADADEDPTTDDEQGPRPGQEDHA